jgi:HEAT repeat protein
MPVRPFTLILRFAGLILGTLLGSPPLYAEQIVEQLPLGALVTESPHIALLQVEKADARKRTITFKKTADLKGRDVAGRMRHDLGALTPEGHVDRIERAVLEWAVPGKKAVCFQSDNQMRVCLGNYWYLAALADDEEHTWAVMWWLEQFTTAYAGPIDKLCAAVTGIAAGREVVVTARVSGWESLTGWEGPSNPPSPVHRDWLRGKKGRVWRIKASEKITQLISTYAERKTFVVGWGVGATEMPRLLKELEHKDARVRAEAAEDLGQLGADARGALPKLRDALRDPDGHVRVFAAEAITGIDLKSLPPLDTLLAALQDGDQDVRGAAAAALAGLGARAGDAVPAFLAALRLDKDKYVRSVAAYALGQIVPRCKPPREDRDTVLDALARALQRDTAGDVRFWSARALLKFGPDAQRALPALTTALKEDRSAVAEVAADVLARLGPVGLPALIANLRADWTAPWDYLSEIGPRARAAVPALTRLLTKADGWRQPKIAAALLRIDPKCDTTVVPLLAGAIQETRHPDAVRFLADEEVSLEALKPLVPALRAALQTGKHWDRALAAKILGKAGPEAKAALADLRAVAEDGKEPAWSRAAAAKALWQINRDPQALPLLVSMIRDKDLTGRGGSAEVVASLGADGEPALPALRQAMHDQDDPDRVGMALAFWHIARRQEAGGVIFDPRREAVSVLAEMLQDNDAKNEWGSVARALARMGAEARPAVPLLVRLLDDGDPGDEEQALETLAAIGPEAREAVPALLARIEQDDEAEQEAATLLHIDPRPEAVALLGRMLDRGRGCYWFVMSLDTLGPQAKPAVPLLLRLLCNKDHEIYQRAARALRRLDPKAADTAGVP